MSAIKILIILIIIPTFVAGQVSNDSLTLLNLPKVRYDYKKCVVTIKTGDRDTKGKIFTFRVLMTVTNTSADTLKYGMWSTEWLNYHIKSTGNELRISGVGEDVLHNFLETLVLPPGGSHDFPIEVIKRKGDKNFTGEYKFRFRLYLVRPNELMEGLILNAKDGSFSHLPAEDVNKRIHWIWSNMLKM